MATFKGDLVYPAEKYIDRQTNEEKTRWLKCGSVFENDEGKLSVKITAMPTVLEAGNWFRVFEPRNNEQQGQGGFRGGNPQPADKPKQTGFEDDDIPF